MKNSIKTLTLLLVNALLSIHAYSASFTYNNGWNGATPNLTKNDDVTVTAGTWTVTSVTNLATLYLNGGNLDLSNELTAGGNNGTTVIVNGKSTIISSSSASRIGPLYVNSGAELTFSGSMLKMPSLDLNGGKLFLASSAFDISPGAPKSAPDVTVTANSSIVGNGTQNRLAINGSTLFINGGDLTINNAEVIVNSINFVSSNFVRTLNSGLLAFDNSNHTIANASSSSHVIGTIRVYLTSISQTPYVWPLGDGTTLASVKLNPTTKDVNGVTLSNVSGTYGTHYIDIKYVGLMNSNTAIDNTLKSVSGAEYWIFTRSSSQPAATLGFYVNSGISKTLVTSNNISGELDLASISLSTNQWTFLDATVTSSGGTNVLVTTTNSIDPNKVITFGTNTTTTTFLTPLPVSIVDFSAKANAANIDVKWSTAYEKDNMAFVVEKSLDGQTWSAIGTVKGAKTSNVVNNYGLVDYKAVAGFQYYRLKQIDLDGTVSFSKAIAVNFSNASTLNVNLFPNPSNDALNITTGNNETGEVHIQIISSMGETVYNKVVDAGLVQSIDISSFIPGVYYVTVIAEGESKIIRLLKN